MDETEATPSESSSEEPGQAPEAAAPESEAPETPHDIPLPPATFDFLVLSLRSQAEMHLGLLHFGEEKDRPKPNLPLARHSIDMLAMLVEKTKGNLTTDEQRMLENSLTELRFRFVEASKGGAG
jgi:hypothetical protein